MGKVLGIKYTRLKQKGEYIYTNKTKYSLCFYADDFVIMCRAREDAENIRHLLSDYLAERGLTLAEDKTKITHVTKGFDFLGFNVRRYRVTNKKGGKEGVKLLIKPSKASVKTLKAKIADVFARAKGNNASALIGRLNPIITGTANFWLPTVAKEIFSDIDNYAWEKTRRWLVRTHPRKNWDWKIKRYFKPDKTGQSKNKWILTAPDTGNQLKRMAWTPIVRHTLIKHDSSPFDYTLKEYFQRRDVKEFTRNNIASRQKLARQQNYVCPMCGMSIADFKEGLEVHHKISKIHGGNDEYKNLQLVHISCHIDYHKVFPAKGAIPTQAQIRSYCKIIRKLRLAGEQ
jgi:RNA-directed DNA polymerase